MSYDYWYYTPSIPRTVKGGIKAQTKRGEFGKSWWAKRWISILRDFNMGARLERGMSYARRGQVISIDVQSGMVRAKVQGSSSRPYSVKIKVKTLGMPAWEKLAKALFTRPVIAAGLLSGQMPEHIEDVFRDAKLSLFPANSADLSTDCSCPDWSNPCKHIAAVYFLLGEEFDRDPFLIFKMRGTERKDLLGMVGLKPISVMEPTSDVVTAAATVTATTKHGSVSESSSSSSSYRNPDRLQPQPLPSEHAEFWGQVEPENEWKDGSQSELVSIPQIHAALPKRLGSFPFWRSEKIFISTMEDAYRNASSAGLDAFIGGRQSGDSKD